LETQFSPEMSFKDVDGIAQNSAWDCISGSTRFAPWVNLFWAGFSCKSRSSLNRKRSANANCLQRQDLDAETSATFEGIFQYIARVRPQCLILENVATLLEKLTAESQSDADYVLSRLASVGYVGLHMKFDCEDFGSRASRIRLCFMAWQVAPDGSELNTASRAYMDTLEHVRWLERFLEHLAIGPLPVNLFLTCDVGEASAHFSQFEVGRVYSGRGVLCFGPESNWN
jgi:site-specific DNA-cytosine methylase